MALSALVRPSAAWAFNPQHPIYLAGQGGTRWGCVSQDAPNLPDLLGNAQKGGTNPPHVVVPYLGKCVDYSLISDEALFLNAAPLTVPAAWIFGAFFQNKSNANNLNGLVFIGSGTSGSAAFGLQLGSVTNQLSISASVAVLSGLVAAFNVPYFAAASIISGTIANFVLKRLDTGALLTSSQATTRTLLNGDGTICYGSSHNGGSIRSARGPVAAGVAISGYVDLPSLAAWASDPWAIFARPTPSLFSAPVVAGIQFDATSNSTYQTADASYTWNHTCTGANRYLVVTIAMLSVAGSSVSAITYNSVNLVFLGARATVSGTVRLEMWGLVAPATGTNVIAVTLSASLDSVGEAASFTGVHQTVSTEAFNTATGTATGGDASVTVTSVADNDWVVSGVASDDTAITIATGTQRQNVSGALGSGGLSTFGPETPAGGVAMTWTGIGALASWAIAGVALRPLAASGLPSQGWGGLLAGWRNFLVGGGDDD